MLTETGFEKMAEAIAAANDLPLELARKYAGLIGDTPELADDGRIVVSDKQGRELARILVD